MVKLNNIKIKGDIISCDIFPEDSKEAGSLCCRISTRKVISYTLPNDYSWCLNHVAHAKRALLEIAMCEEIPPERFVFWA